MPHPATDLCWCKGKPFQADTAAWRAAPASVRRSVKSHPARGCSPSSCHCHGFRTPKWAAVFSRSSLCPSILYAPDAAIDIAGVLARPLLAILMNSAGRRAVQATPGTVWSLETVVKWMLASFIQWSQAPQDAKHVKRLARKAAVHTTAGGTATSCYPKPTPYRSWGARARLGCSKCLGHPLQGEHCCAPAALRMPGAGTLRCEMPAAAARSAHGPDRAAGASARRLPRQGHCRESAAAQVWSDGAADSALRRRPPGATREVQLPGRGLADWGRIAQLLLHSRAFIIRYMPFSCPKGTHRLDLKSGLTADNMHASAAS